MRVDVYGKDKESIWRMENLQSLELSHHHFQNRSVISPGNKQGYSRTDHTRKVAHQLGDKLDGPTNSSEDPTKIK